MKTQSTFDMLQSTELEDRLLSADEPPAFSEFEPHGKSSFVIAVDHGSRRIPRRLGNLGLAESELQRHIAWDIGSLAVARQVAAALGAPLVAQNYSRLVIDCNRDPGVATSIPRISEHIEIPGNNGLRPQDVLVRRREIFDPYHERLRSLLDERLAAGRPEHSGGTAQHDRCVQRRPPRHARCGAVQS